VSTVRTDPIKKGGTPIISVGLIHKSPMAKACARAVIFRNTFGTLAPDGHAGGWPTKVTPDAGAEPAFYQFRRT